MPDLPQPPDQSAPIVLPAFGLVEAERVLAHDDLFAVVRDKYPISPGHTLIIARRAIARFQDLTALEKERLVFWVERAQQHLSAGSFRRRHAIGESFR